MDKSPEAGDLARHFSHVCEVVAKTNDDLIQHHHDICPAWAALATGVGANGRDATEADGCDIAMV